MTTLGFAFSHLAALAVAAAGAFALGCFLTGSLAFAGSLERSVFQMAIGLGALGSLIHILGLLGAIRPAAVAILIAGPLAVLLVRRRTSRGAGPFPGRLGSAMCLTLALGAAPAAILALYPPTAFDATLYHLPFAKAFVALHATAFLPALRDPVFPQLVEMLYTAALALSDDVTAQLLHVLCLLLTAAALVAWGRRLASARAGAWAAAAWLGSPIVISTGAAAYVDAGLALFCTLSLFAWSLARETGDRRFLGWSAALAGFAACTKYHGLFFVFAIPIAMVITGRRAAGRQALAYLGIALLVLSPFYARIVLETGNPLFPYFSGWFGQSAWSESLDPIPPSERAGSRPQERVGPPAVERIFGELFLPGDERPRRTPLSPFLLLVPPLAAGAALVDRRQRALAAVLLAYAGACLALTPAARFLFPIIPAAAVLGASFADRFLARSAIAPGRQRVAATALALVLILPGAAFGWRRIWRQGSIPVTPESREAYLDRQVLVHGALRLLNETRGRDYTVYCLYCESAAYFADGLFRGDYFGPYAFSRVEGAMGSAGALHATLRDMGITHLIVRHTPGEPPMPVEPTLSELFTPLPAPPGVSLFALR